MQWSSSESPYRMNLFFFFSLLTSLTFQEYLPLLSEQFLCGWEPSQGPRHLLLTEALVLRWSGSLYLGFGQTSRSRKPSQHGQSSCFDHLSERWFGKCTERPFCSADRNYANSLKNRAFSLVSEVFQIDPLHQPRPDPEFPEKYRKNTTRAEILELKRIPQKYRKIPFLVFWGYLFGIFGVFLG